MSNGRAAKHRAMQGRFRAHLRANVGYAAVVLGGTLAAGMIGYHSLADLDWVDAFLNAAMLLSGMGPVAELRTDGAKIFAGLYAIWSGIVILATVGLMLAPVVGHALHRFHLETDKD